MRRYFLLIILVFFSWGTPAYAKNKAFSTELTVLAEPSLAEVMVKLARLYSTEHNITITTLFRPTQELVEYIQDGNIADIIITAHPYWIIQLRQKGLINIFSIKTIAKNKLAFVASDNHPLLKSITPRTSLADAMLRFSKGVSLVMADPETVELGMYSKQVAERLGLYLAIEPYTIKSFSSEDSLYLIEQGEKAGIVFQSDALRSSSVKTIKKVPDNLYTPIIYQAAVVAGETRSYNRDFLNFLKSAKAQETFKRYGFITE